MDSFTTSASNSFHIMETTPSSTRDNRELLGQISVAQYKAMQKNSRMLYLVLLSATLLLVGISVGLITIYMTNKDLRTDLEITREIAENLSSSLADVQSQMGQRESKAGYFQGFTSDHADSPTKGAGTVYTRWGNSSCPPTAETVYDGIIGGSYYTQSGGAAQYLCLPHDPIYGEVQPASNEKRSLIYSTELQYPGFALLEHMQHHDAACSVCRTLDDRLSVLTMPAQNICPSGWTVEYDGYLMSASQDHKRTEYLCVDSNPTILRNAARDLNGALLFPVEARCNQGNLPCPPYVDGYELSCAVCSK